MIKSFPEDNFIKEVLLKTVIPETVCHQKIRLSSVNFYRKRSENLLIKTKL